MIAHIVFLQIEPINSYMYVLIRIVWYIILCLFRFNFEYIPSYIHDGGVAYPSEILLYTSTHLSGIIGVSRISVLTYFFTKSLENSF